MPDNVVPADRSQSDQAQLRVSDSDREHVAGQLREHAATGRITMAELEQRAERAYAAKTQAELAVLVSDLPVAGASALPAKRRHWALSILGSSSRRIRRRVRHLTSIAIMASPDIDLCHSEFDGDEIVVRGFVLWGWPDIYLPDSVGLDQGGFTLMGGDHERGSSRVPPAGAPVVKVRTYGLIGGYTVWRLPTELQDLPPSKARKAAKELPRSAG